jgi:deoxyribonuclease-4
MRIGMHVRGFARGKPVAVEEGVRRGAETLQIFSSNPRTWRRAPLPPDAAEALARAVEAHDIGPLFLHVPYLVNLASPNPVTRDLSFQMLEAALERAASCGGAGIVVHAGSAAGDRRGLALRRQARAICRLLAEATAGPGYLLELTAGAPGHIASRFPAAAELLDACQGHARLGICIDTCHLHAAGYDLSGAGGVDETMAELEEHIGWDRLRLVHANDSRDPCGSRRDRHWHVGEGSIGEEGFRALVAHPNLARVPFICETPGDAADDRRNLAFLKALRAGHRTVSR